MRIFAASAVLAIASAVHLRQDGDDTAECDDLDVAMMAFMSVDTDQSGDLSKAEIIDAAYTGYMVATDLWEDQFYQEEGSTDDWWETVGKD